MASTEEHSSSSSEIDHSPLGVIEAGSVVGIVWVEVAVDVAVRVAVNVSVGWGEGVSDDVGLGV
ncbi:MAG: hypothetical protein P8Y37_01750 [Anaerolineales bacterium]